MRSQPDSLNSSHTELLSLPVSSLLGICPAPTRLQTLSLSGWAQPLVSATNSVSPLSRWFSLYTHTHPLPLREADHSRKISSPAQPEVPYRRYSEVQRRSIQSALKAFPVHLKDERSLCGDRAVNAKVYVSPHCRQTTHVFPSYTHCHLQVRCWIIQLPPASRPARLLQDWVAPALLTEARHGRRSVSTAGMKRIHFPCSFHILGVDMHCLATEFQSEMHNFEIL